MTLQIHTDLQGNLSAVWRDPYEWVDPFAEAEKWALRVGQIAQVKDAYAEFLRCRIDALHYARMSPEMRAVWDATSNPETK
jgi:hypothetical protein